ncbi:MFS transporter [Tersicoccus solisilvae]|uniref:MFS transporter n=1 Tax=Tersicoccus solisilvae TaxID=1882339 RepID=A0ABQ1NWZ5_9MICC|nr:MFS transporter [Tersicoccus solisilvae]GGC86857.1 MFS transporter [Tersicoccus solisilvae]
MAGRDDFSLRRFVVPVFGPSVLFAVGEGAILPVVPLTARDLGGSVAVAALIVTLIGIGSLLSNIPASIVTARIGERWAIVAAAALCAIGMLLALLAPNLAVLAVAVFLIGSSAAVFNLARQLYLTVMVEPRYRARALSSLGGSMRIGLFIGPFVGAAVMHLTGLGGAYVVGVVALVIAGAIALSMPDPPLPTRSLPVITTDETAGGTAAAGPRAEQPERRPVTIRSVLRSHRRIYATVGVAVVFVAAVRQARQVVIPLWAEGLGLDPSATSLVYGISGAVDMLVFYPAGKVMDTRGRLAVAAPSMLIMGVALLLCPLTTATGPFLLVAVLLGFGNGIGSGLVMTLGADYSPPDGRVQFLGVWRFMADAGATAGPLVLSAVTDAVSLASGVAATGALGLIAAALFVLFLPRVRPIRA